MIPNENTMNDKITAISEPIPSWMELTVNMLNNETHVKIQPNRAKKIPLFILIFLKG